MDKHTKRFVFFSLTLLVLGVGILAYPQLEIYWAGFINFYLGLAPVMQLWLMVGLSLIITMPLTIWVRMWFDSKLIHSNKEETGNRRMG